MRRLFVVLIVGAILLAPSLGISASAQTTDWVHRMDRLDRAADRAQRRELERDNVVDRRSPDVARGEQNPGGLALIIIDERGDRIRRGEVLALNISDTARAAARQAGLTVVRMRILSSGDELFVFRSETLDDPSTIIERLREIDPDGDFSLNHVYAPSQQAGDFRSAGPPPQSHDLSGGRCEFGLIDGQPDFDHPRLESAVTAAMSFEEHPAGPSFHGTAVALRLVDASHALDRQSLASICAADVFSAESVGAVSADALSAAIAWQQEQAASVVNISLAGPPNLIVEQMIATYQRSGGVVVAAVGNGGPLSRQIYPAAYEDVVGVTAIDNQDCVYPMATVGAHVDVAARGVSVVIDGLEATEPLDGTSYAAPVVAAWMIATSSETTALMNSLVDIGSPGRDDVTGFGRLPLALD